MVARPERTEPNFQFPSQQLRRRALQPDLIHERTYLIENRRIRDRIQPFHLSGNMNINAGHPGIYDHEGDSGQDHINRN